MYLEGTYNDSMNKAYKLLNQGNVEQSIKLFNKITDSYPNTAQAYHLKAYAYLKAGNNKSAYDNFTRAHNLDPVSVDITMDFANFLSQIGKTDEALNLQQRMKRSRLMKRMKTRIKIGRERAKRKMANKDKLLRRARRQARDQIARKLTRGIPKKELTFARKKEIEKRLEKPALQARINRIAKRMFKDVRKAEVQRKKG